MKKLRWTTLCGALMLLLLCTMPANAFEIGARALYWFPTFKTDMKADNGGTSGDTINIKDQLGVGTKYFPTFEVFGGLGKHEVSLAYTPIAYSGSTTLSSPVTFNGKTFAAGSNVDTDLKLRMLDLQYQYKFLDLENFLAGFSLGPIVQIKYIDGEASMSNSTTSADFTIRYPIPMVGLGAHVGLLLNLLEMRAKVTGIAYSSNYLYEAMAELSLTPFPFLDINAGYKVIGIKIDHNDVFLNSQFTGPYLGLTVSF